MNVVLYDDATGFLEPLTLTRPVFELRCGLDTLAAKQLWHFGAPLQAVFVREPLAQIWRDEHPDVAVNTPLQETPLATAVAIVNGRWLPPPTAASIQEPAIGLVDDEIAWVLLCPKQARGLSPRNLAERLTTYQKELPVRQAGGRLVRFPWDLVRFNGEQLCQDFARHAATMPGRLDATSAVIGPRERLWLAATAHLDPLVVIDTRLGPVVIDDHAVVTAFTRIEGPCHIGPHTHVLGAKVRGETALGPMCRVGGEIEASIIHAYSNKYHDGFLGHAYVGEWVNLGAGTCNSDLRNDYGPVQVPIHGKLTATGLTKVGCFIGDHSKTGLGTLLNTGSSVGVFCNLLPAGRLAPKHVPSFTTWWNGNLRESADWGQLLTTAGEVMRRRGRPLTDAHRELYLHVFDETALERRRALRDADSGRRRQAG
ncbi:MAG: hypothetical protein FJ271_20200 [Planctomycetes bacterium]|nr:hypothetical protein [Planctomycetota bacterium]